MNWLCLPMLLGLIVVAGCGKGGNPKPQDDLNTVANKVMDAQTAFRLAGAEARSRGWDKVVLQKVEETDTKWDIFITMEPAMPGGHAIVRVSKDGKKVDFQGGM